MMRHDVPMIRSRTRSSRRLTALLAAAMVVPMACGFGRESGPVDIDLREPTTVSDIDPDARTFTLTGIDGPAEFTVRFPRRTVVGDYRGVTLIADENVDPAVPADDPARAIRHVELARPTTDDPELVVQRIREAVAEFDADGEELAEIDAFIADFEANVAANDGSIVTDSFVPPGESAIFVLGLTTTEYEMASLRVRFFTDDVVLIVTQIRFDPEAGPPAS
jgi:hypothetical protein